MSRRKPLSIAHRGAHARYPENSLPAILAALDAGAEGVEIDVHATSDGALILHHDPALEDGREIAALSSKEFAAIELAPGIGVATLEDALEAVAGRAILFIETKVEGVEYPLMRAVRRSRADSAIHSFHHHTVQNIKLTMPAVRTGILTEGAAVSAIAAARAANADDVWHSAPDVTGELVSGCRRLGKQVIAWTANSLAECERLESLGVDGICSDDVRVVKAVAG